MTFILTHNPMPPFMLFFTHCSLALREVVEKYPWFVTLLKRARLGELAMNNPVSTKLECLEEVRKRKS